MGKAGAATSFVFQPYKDSGRVRFKTGCSRIAGSIVQDILTDS